MSVTLDDIWDTPAQPPSREHTPAAIIIDDDLPGPSPAKRPRTRLFFSDSEDESPSKPTTPRASAPSKQLDPAINALFDDLDDDDAPVQLAPSLDMDALRRQAAARHAANIPSLTPREIHPSSSPPRDGEMDEDGETRKKGTGDGEKKRKPLPRLNEARLLGPDGFPALVKQTKGFKPKGKGHEVCLLHVQLL